MMATGIMLSMPTMKITTHLTQTQTSKGLADKVYLLPVTPDYVEQVMLCILCFVHLGQFS